MARVIPGSKCRTGGSVHCISVQAPSAKGVDARQRAVAAALPPRNYTPRRGPAATVSVRGDTPALENSLLLSLDRVVLRTSHKKRARP